MPRRILAEPRIHAAIGDTIATHHAGAVHDVQKPVTEHSTPVVVGVRQNLSGGCLLMPFTWRVSGELT